jgi:hypothetical protein
VVSFKLKHTICDTAAASAYVPLFKPLMTDLPNCALSWYMYCLHKLHILLKGYHECIIYTAIFNENSYYYYNFTLKLPLNNLPDGQYHFVDI